MIIRENPKPQVLNVPIHLNITYWKDAEKIWNEADRFSVIPSNNMKINVSKLFEKTKTFCFFGGLVNDEHKEVLIFLLEQIISYVPQLSISINKFLLQSILMVYQIFVHFYI